MSYDVLFDPTEEHRALRAMVRDFTRNEVEPQAAAFDAKGELNVALLRQLGDLGLLGITVPAEHGGAGMDTVAAVIPPVSTADVNSLTLCLSRSRSP